MKLIKMAKGAIIYFEDKVDNRVYIIRNGKVELKKNEGYFLVNDFLKKNTFLVEGDVFGFEEIFMKAKRLSRATAVEDCELLYFEQEEFANVLKGNIKIGEKILNSLSGKIRAINDRIKSISVIECQDKCAAEDNEGKPLEIFYYFIKNSEFKKAIDVLERLKNYEKYKKFAEEQIVKLLQVQEPGISEERIDKIVGMYTKEESEILAYILEGLRLRIEDNELYEKILCEKITILKGTNLDNEFVEEAEKFLSCFPGSKYKKRIIFDVVEKYQEIGLYPQALKAASMLIEMKLEPAEFERVKKIVDKLQTAVS